MFFCLQYYTLQKGVCKYPKFWFWLKIQCQDVQLRPREEVSAFLDKAKVVVKLCGTYVEIVHQNANTIVAEMARFGNHIFDEKTAHVLANKVVCYHHPAKGHHVVALESVLGVLVVGGMKGGVADNASVNFHHATKAVGKVVHYQLVLGIAVLPNGKVFGNYARLDLVFECEHDI